MSNYDSDGTQTERRPQSEVAHWVWVGLGSLLGLVVFMFALAFGMKAFSRYQTRQDAQNRVKVSTIEIRNQAQRIKVAQQQAEIRHANAVGLREAQQEIAKTLTPLYVQLEAFEAVKAIAASGKNNSVIFMPSGASGIPLIYDAASATKVGVPRTDSD